MLRTLPAIFGVIAASTFASLADPGFRFLYVDAKAPPGGDGLTWDTAFNDLQDALDDIKDPAFFPEQVYYLRVKVAGGTYRPDRGTRDRNACFDFSRARPFPISEVYFYGG